MIRNALSDYYNKVRNSISTNTVVTSLLTTLIIVIIAGTTFVILRLKTTYEMQKEILLLKSQLSEYRNHQDSVIDVIAETQNEMWKTVYGELEPQVRKGVVAKIPVVPRVSLTIITKNIEENRIRITQLERSRLQHEGRLRRLEEQ